MKLKGKIAMALQKAARGIEPSEGMVLTRAYANAQAESIMPIIDAILTPEQIIQEYLKYYTKRFHNEAEAHNFVENLNIGAGQAIAKAQLNSPKLKAYIEEQVKAERECLDVAREAIMDAITCEDGLDGKAGRNVVIWITDILGDDDEFRKRHVCIED